MGNACPMVKNEAIKLIIIAYQDGLDNKVVMKAYKCLEHVALTSTDAVVQIQSLEFWCKVTVRHLSTQGNLNHIVENELLTKNFFGQLKHQIGFYQKNVAKHFLELKL